MDWFWDSNNYEWLLDVLHNHLSISYAPQKNEQLEYFYFSLTLKDTEIFLSHYFEATLE